MNGGLAHLVEVKPRVAHRALERSDKRFRCGLGGAVGERGERSVDDVDACHRSHQIDHVARAARVVRVQMNGHVDRFLQALDKRVSVHRQ